MNVLAILLLVAAAMLQSGCQAQSGPLNSQTRPPDSTTQAFADRELVKEVERFASGDATEAASAWKDLMRQDRETLIKELSRISSELPTDDRDRVFIAYTFCKMGHDYDSNSRVILSALSKNSPYKDLDGDWVANLLGNLLIDGHKDLLAPVFEASEWSDGAMSTELARVYSEALLMDTDSFLASLSAQSENTRNTVVMLLHDNSLTSEQNEKIKRYLKTVVPPSKLAPVASQILKTLSKS